ncbi:pirin family protein [Acinetobacter sp. TSRC1-2]|uniref:pirin family protein n=1 Tax=unclassified Acinetobacter TaxID=196816 RepID=UPI003CEF5AD1
MHPYRSFETVIIIHDSESEHHDSKGNYSKNRMQWMTAGKDILHKESHPKDFPQPEMHWIWSSFK